MEMVFSLRDILEISETRDNNNDSFTDKMKYPVPLLFLDLIEPLLVVKYSDKNRVCICVFVYLCGDQAIL